MGVEVAEEPSLAQAPAEMVHREHNHARLHHNQHNHLHKRQSASSVTEVTATISVIQQVNVDGNGSTIGTSTVLATDPTVEAPTGLTVVDASGNPVSGSTNPSASPSATISNSLISITTSTESQSLQSSQTLPLTSTPFSATAAPSAGTNVTSLTLSSGFPSSNQTTSLLFSNSTTSSTSSNSSTSSSYSLSSFSSSSSTSGYSSSTSLLSTTSSSYSTSSSSLVSSTTAGGNGGIVGTTPASTATNAAGSGAAGTSSNDSSNTPSGGVIAGGVVGGVAGVALLVILAFMLLRWKRKNGSILPLGDGRNPSNARALTGDPAPGSTAPPMAQQPRSIPFAVPAVLAGFNSKRKSAQSRASAAHSSTAGSEHGFYRVSGRKITSVLESGGDGYGDSPPANRNTVSSTSTGPVIPNRDTFSGASFYRDSQGWYGGGSSPTSPVTLSGPLSTVTAAFAPSSQASRDSGPIMSGRSPARTPVISAGPFTEPLEDIPASPIDPPPRRPDLVGRSHPSQDGSKGSKFHEDV